MPGKVLAGLRVECYSCPILTQIDTFQTFVGNVFSIEFYETPSLGIKLFSAHRRTE